MVAAGRRARDDGPRHARPDRLRLGPAPDPAGAGGAGHGRGRRVLADRRDLRLPHGRVRRRGRDPAPDRLRRHRRARGDDRAAGSPDRRRPRPAGDRAHDGAGRGPALDLRARGARAAREGRRLRLRARRVRRRAGRGAGARDAGGSRRADAPRGHRLRVPDPHLLRHDGHGLRPRQPPHDERARPGGDLPRAPARRPRRVVAPLAPGPRPAGDRRARVLRRDGPAADRRDRRHRDRPGCDRQPGRRVADRRRHVLRAALPRGRDRPRRLPSQPGRRTGSMPSSASTSRPRLGLRGAAQSRRLTRRTQHGREAAMPRSEYEYDVEVAR